MAITSNFLRKVTIIPIILYQKTLSPDHGFMRVFFKHGFCRFYPSCSEYTRLAVIKHGIFKGFFKGFYRVLRCNPWNKGGIDQP
jgi:putative membrane protein insertion efficiency factor